MGGEASRERSHVTEFSVLSDWCCADTHLAVKVRTPPDSESETEDASLTPESKSCSRGSDQDLDEVAPLPAPTGRGERRPRMPIGPSLEEQRHRNVERALTSYYQAIEVERQRHSADRASSSTRRGGVMHWLEGASATVFPDLPVGMGLNAALWAWTNAIEGASVVLVQLSPLLVPLLIGLAVQVHRFIGLGPTLMYSALAIATLMWADAYQREQNMLPLPHEYLKAESDGKPVRAKAPEEEDAETGVARVDGEVYKPPDGTKQSRETAAANRGGGAHGVEPTGPIAGSRDGVAPGVEMVGYDARKTAADLADIKAQLNELHQDTYGEDAEVTTISDCHQTACKLCHDCDVDPPMTVNVPALQAAVKALQASIHGGHGSSTGGGERYTSGTGSADAYHAYPAVVALPTSVAAGASGRVAVGTAPPARVAGPVVAVPVVAGPAVPVYTVPGASQPFAGGAVLEADDPSGQWL